MIHHVTFQKSKIKPLSNGFIEWLGDFLFYMLDILLVPELYENTLALLKSQYRFLSQDEILLAKKYFGKSINLDHIRINSQMSNRIEKFAHAYVTLNTINYNTYISKAIFIHELVHIWQYQQFGSVYIFRALKAQVSKEKYNYGGLEGLYAGMIGQKGFLSFNFEQQGAIIEDYCRLIEMDDNVNSIVTATYAYYAAQLKEYKTFS